MEPYAAWAAAADALLADDAPESRRELARLFGNRHLPHDRDGARPRVLARCAAAGMAEPYRFYLGMLGVGGRQLPVLSEKGERVGTSYYEPSVAEAFAAEVVREFAPGDAAVKGVVAWFPAAKDQVPHLREWLKSRAGRRDGPWP